MRKNIGSFLLIVVILTVAVGLNSAAAGGPLVSAGEFKKIYDHSEMAFAFGDWGKTLFSKLFYADRAEKQRNSLLWHLAICNR